MNCSDLEQQIAVESQSVDLAEHLKICERCREFAQELEQNTAALRELSIPPAVFATVRQRVISEIQVKDLRTMWWTWSAVAAAACLAILCVSYVLPRLQKPVPPAPVVAKMIPPKIEWTPQSVAQRVRHKTSGRFAAQAAPVRKTEPLAVVKMLTDDPNVIIIWLVDQKGDSL
jgi:hypothetical protein